jgi:hypothetical protein
MARTAMFSHEWIFVTPADDAFYRIVATSPSNASRCRTPICERRDG